MFWQLFQIYILQKVNAITQDLQFVGMDTENFSYGLQAFDWFPFKQFLSQNGGTDYSRSLGSAVPAD